MTAPRTPKSDRDRPTMLELILQKHGLPAGLILTAIGMAPNFLDIPLISRWDVWGALLVFLAFVISAHLSTPPSTLPYVVTGIALLGLVGFELSADLPNNSGKPNAPADPNHAPLPLVPTVTHVSDDPIATLEAFNHQWVLHADGDIEGVGANVVYHVSPPAVAMTACGGALIVTHDHGKIARVSPASGRVLADYSYAHQSGDVTCGGGYVWAAKPDLGSVVQLQQHSLADVNEFPLVSTATSITYGNRTVWVLDGPDADITGVNILNREKLGPYAIMDDAQQILFAENYLWVLHRRQSCLRRLNPGHSGEIGPGVPLGPYPYRMRFHDGTIYVADYDDDSVLEVNADAARATGTPVVLGRSRRLIDANEFGGVLEVIDAAHNQLLSVGPATSDALRAKHPYVAGPQCPPT